MNGITLSVAEGTRQKASNKIYSSQVEVDSLEALKHAFRNNERSNSNFIKADCVMMDCDNEHTDNSADWLTPETLAARLPDVAFACVYSKSHMKSKDDSSPRPRFHVYFSLRKAVNTAQRIRELKEALLVLVPEFDHAAKDAARFFFGVEHPQVSLHEGSICVDEFLTMHSSNLSAEAEGLADDDTAAKDAGDTQFTVGSRHNTLLKVAVNALSRYPVQQARAIFDKACARCKPPIPIAESMRIWDWATQAVKDIKAKERKVLTLPIVEQTLAESGVSVCFNVITKDIEVSPLPQNSEFVPAAYYTLDSYAQAKAAPDILPAALCSYFKAKNYGVSSQFIADALNALAATHPHNPVLDMLNSTVWDGQDRISQLCAALRIQHNDYHCAFVRKWLHQAIAVALNDDGTISPEFALVLQGAQGIGKTNFFRRLAVRPEWFKEGAVIDMRDKDSRIESTSVWICELGELDSTLKREQASLKAFLTSNFDTYRKPYARKATKVERRTCFCATVNPEQAIRDDTGSRRYIFIHVNSIDRVFIYETMTPEWCAQLWRQVYEELYLELGRTAFYLAPDERAYAEKGNDNFTVPLEGELELLDALDWAADYTEWEYYSLSDLKAAIRGLERVDIRKLGRAVTKVLSSRGYNIDNSRRLLHGRTEYFLPRRMPQHDVRAFEAHS